MEQRIEIKIPTCPHSSLGDFNSRASQNIAEKTRRYIHVCHLTFLEEQLKMNYLTEEREMWQWPPLRGEELNSRYLGS